MVYDPNQWRDREATPGWSPDGNGRAFRGGSSYGQNAYDTDIDRDRALGAAAQGTAPVTLDQGQSFVSRKMEMGGLGMLEAQANGTAPSSAAILGQRVNQDATHNAGVMMTGAKSAAGGIAGLRGSQGQTATTMLAGNAKNADIRAREISQGQSAYASGAGTVNAQDIGVATSNAQLAAQQRAIDEQRQQFFERQAYDTRGVQRQAETDSIAQLHRQLAQDRAYKAAKTAADVAGVKDTISLASGGISGAASAAGSSGNPKPDTNSDQRMKYDVGSLSHLTRKRP